MTELLIIVPARCGSKRLPGKNLKKLAGESLLAHTAHAISAAGILAPVLLTTDDDRIAAEGERLGWSVPFRRPADLASDNAATFDTILHALDWFKGASGSDPDAVLVLQPSSPLRGGVCLVSALNIIRTQIETDSVVAVSALHIPPAHIYSTDVEGFAHPLDGDDLRRPLYVPNGAVYLTRTKALRQDGSLYAGKIRPLIMEPARSIDIDNEDDWWLAETLHAAGLPEDSAPMVPGISANEFSQ